MEHSDAALAAAVAQEAGEFLLAVRDRLGVHDPYTLGAAGDRHANTLILDRLRDARPDDAILSEEAVDDLGRLKSDRVWIVDPVDGTREYGLGRPDWAVHIALWQRGSTPHGSITDAAVALPARGEVYRTDEVSPPPSRTPGPIRVATSTYRPPPVVWWMRDVLDMELVGIGSAGAKAMAVVRGDVDAYVHAGGQWEWDSAAPAGVVLAAGLHVSRLDGSPMRYNRPDPYLPDFVMCRPELADTLLDAVRAVS
ncbi:3'(2'), 5'-bisphosphate nucleotidase [Mycobacterium sp. MAA66]|uniref:3'(2'),5'-bisphosphate nucleotidase CysQ n=1 Tax=Mycobacterium sp. MAA66 TaxID=3156297 RepID=UPI0035180EB7